MTMLANETDPMLVQNCRGALQDLYIILKGSRNLGCTKEDDACLMEAIHALQRIVENQSALAYDDSTILLHECEQTGISLPVFWLREFGCATAFPQSNSRELLFVKVDESGQPERNGEGKINWQVVTHAPRSMIKTVNRWFDKNLDPEAFHENLPGWGQIWWVAENDKEAGEMQRDLLARGCRIVSSDKNSGDDRVSVVFALPKATASRMLGYEVEEEEWLEEDSPDVLTLDPVEPSGFEWTPDDKPAPRG